LYTTIRSLDSSPDSQIATAILHDISTIDCTSDSAVTGVHRADKGVVAGTGDLALGVEIDGAECRTLVDICNPACRIRGDHVTG